MGFILTLLALMAQPPSQVEEASRASLTYRGGVDLVTVSVVARDRNGRPVTGLSPADFELFDAGERRPIASFESTPAPISLAVLVDVSGSMAVTPKPAAARIAVGQLMSWLEAGSDRAALYEFDTRLKERQAFTTTPGDLARELESMQPFGATSLYDAIAETGRRVAAQPGARRAVVVVTDGLDNSSQLSPSEVSGIASAIDVPVYILVVGWSPSSTETDAGKGSATRAADLPGSLADLARWTGGTLCVAGTPALASVAARQIVSELHHQYVITFESSANAGWHPLAVQTRDDRVVVRARSGYVAGPRVGDQP